MAAFVNFDTNCDKLFVYYLLYGQIMTLRKKVARGNDQPNLNTDMLGDFEIALLVPAEQSKIANGVWTMDVRIRNEKKLLGKLRLKKTGLMHDLLTGKVQVNPNTPKKELT